MSGFTIFGFGFWIGLAVGVGGLWLGTHQSDRSALFSRVRALFQKNP